MSDLPADFTYGYVVGQILLAVGDTADPGSMPDADAPDGTTVTFTPKATALISTNGAIVIPKPIVCTIDAAGNVLDPAGNPGVWLITGNYGVTYQIPGSTLPPHDIVVTGFHTQSEPLKLGEHLTVSAPLTTTEAAVINSRIDSLAVVHKGAEPPLEDRYADMLWVPL